MKKLLLLSALFIFVDGYSQTPLTNRNIKRAVIECLSKNPIDGMCIDCKFGAMPDWDVSNVTNMSRLFNGIQVFNVDISRWNVSNVTDMSRMFNAARFFNQDISDWDVSNVTNMSHMFILANNFNYDISVWDVSNVTNMGGMFMDASKFNQDLSAWDVKRVTTCSGFTDNNPQNNPHWTLPHPNFTNCTP